MMKRRTAVVAGFLAFALAAAPLTSTFAGGRHDGVYYGERGYHGGGPIWSLAGAVVATAAAILTAPIVILAAVAQAPRYYGPPAGPGYEGSSPAPAYYGAPQPESSYAPAAAAPEYYAPPAASYYAPPPGPVYYARPAAAPYYAPRQAYYAPRPAYYAPRPVYYPPPPDAIYYSR